MHKSHCELHKSDDKGEFEGEILVALGFVVWVNTKARYCCCSQHTHQCHWSHG